MLRRLEKEKKEKLFLSPNACKSYQSKGRQFPEEPCEYRTEFQRDRDRILHSKAFRRLMDKTQVFIKPYGDHFRTRLTHTLEVSGVARIIATSLGLNEDLTEAISLGHDLGHTPFGHMGEEVLNKLMEKGFSHNMQSLRTVEDLEVTRRRRGLNLTYEVRDGILNHTGVKRPATLEGQIVKIADRIAYINHDIDDAIRAKIISEEDLPVESLEVLGYSKTERINTLVVDMIENSDGKKEIKQSEEKYKAMMELRSFMTENVYLNDVIRKEGGNVKVETIIMALLDYYIKHPDEISDEYRPLIAKDGIRVVAKDMVAGMTDRFAVQKYEELFVPRF